MIYNKCFIIDFDSTFIKVETLDVLCEIALIYSKEKAGTVKKIKEITDLGMTGELSFRDSLEQRIHLLKANKTHVYQTIEKLKLEVSESFKRNKGFLKKYSDQIYIISNGFKEIIEPVITNYGLKARNVYANDFTFDHNGCIDGFDRDNVLSQDGGKTKLVESLNFQGEVYVIGDGYNDYQIKAAGMADKFYAFTENVKRKIIVEKADHEIPNLDEFLYQLNLNMAISYPKNRINVLLLEGIHSRAEELMRQEGYNVEVYPASLSEEELCQKIKGVSIIGIRSKTEITAKVLQYANRLIAVGTFSIGTNQIDSEACLKKGVCIYNAPYSNTRSVVELVIGEIIMLMRNLPDKIAGMHQGRWAKSANNSFEIRGKKLGIIGYGNIGSQLSALAENMGMEVYYYDIVERLTLGNAKKCATLEEMLPIIDVLSIHVDGRVSNKGFFTKKHFDLMKNGSYLLNLSRGSVVDLKYLKENIEKGKILGAGVDVFPEEPKSNNDEFMSEIRGLNNVILTPHIGGSTLEAQRNIADFVPNRIIEYVNTGTTTNSVNFPEIQLPHQENAHRLIHLHENVPGILAKMNNIFSKHNINITGQYLKTNEMVGYAITDIDKEYNKDVITDLKNIEYTIKFRVLY